MITYHELNARKEAWDEAGRNTLAREEVLEEEEEEGRNNPYKMLIGQLLIRSKLEYSSSVWDPPLRKDIHQLEMVQRRAARFIKHD